MNTANDFFDDPLPEILGGSAKPAGAPVPPAAPYSPANTFTAIPRARREIFTDRCDKCRGSGRFIGYSGRVLGPCFKCKGKGTIDYKSSPAERQQAKVSRDNAKAQRAAKQAGNLAAYKAEHPAEFAWLDAQFARGNSFAMSVLEKFTKFGSLTDGQIVAIKSAIARDTERKTEAQGRIDSAKAIDVSKIEQAFATARERATKKGAMGVRWLKLRLDTFVFMDAPARDQWSAAILVREGDKKLGRISEGKFIRSFACDDPTEARVLAAAADPLASALAYGQKFSQCAVCGLELTNDESIKRGIGPICAAKYGW